MYSPSSADVVQSLGFPADRMTLTQNTIDTRSLIAAARAVQSSQVGAVYDELGLQGRNICVYAGGMYPGKRLPFLMEACELVRQLVPDFEIVCIGAGTDAGVIEQAARRHSWVHPWDAESNRGMM